jgi:hypothetical protein
MQRPEVASRKLFSVVALSVLMRFGGFRVSLEYQFSVNLDAKSRLRRIGIRRELEDSKVL